MPVIPLLRIMDLRHVSESPGQLYPGLLSSLKREI